MVCSSNGIEIVTKQRSGQNFRPTFFLSLKKVVWNCIWGGWQHHNSGFSGAYHQSIFQSNLLWDNFQKHAADQTSNQHTKQAFTTATGGGNTPTVSGKKILLINCTALPNAVRFTYFANAERKPGILKKVNSGLSCKKTDLSKCWWSNLTDNSRNAGKANPPPCWQQKQRQNIQQ